MPAAAKERLVAMLARREIPLIEDDLYGDLHFGPERPHAAQVLRYEGTRYALRLIFKIGRAWLSGRLADAGTFLREDERSEMHQHRRDCTLPQMALADYMANGGYDHHLRALRQALHRQMEHISHAVARVFRLKSR